jgi:hypothetical protein
MTINKFCKQSLKSALAFTLFTLWIICFTAGTQVVVGMEYDENGNFVTYVTMNIEDVQVGALVYSYDTATGEVSQKEVTDTFVRTSDHINYLTIVDENGHEQTLETTDGHPFWVVTDTPDFSRAARSVVDENGILLYHENLEPGLNGFWVEAKDLRVGDVFLGANGELSVLVDSVRVEFDENVAVYNFAVEGNHDYFVIAKGDYGQTCILVHNANFVYRGIAEYEDPSKGLVARNPNANITPALHTAGHPDSQWISTTLDETIARNKFGQYGVVEIDLKKIPKENVVNMSKGIGNPDIDNICIGEREVLIQYFVPPSAIRVLE